MTKRICTDCGTDISDLHGNAKRCVPCRVVLAPPSPRTCSNGCDAPVVGRGLCARCRISDVRLHGPAERLTPEEAAVLGMKKSARPPETSLMYCAPLSTAAKKSLFSVLDLSSTW